MLLVNSYTIKMAAILKSSAEYNKKLEEPQSLKIFALSNGNNSVLWISEINRL